MNEELIEYYVNLLILQYRSLPNATGHMRVLLNNTMIYDLIREIENGYSIDTAVGSQLDILAKYVGATRIVSLETSITRDYWGFVDYSATSYDNVVGVVDYAELNIPDGNLLQYDTSENSTFALTDEELRFIIKMKIIQNNSDHSTKSIDDFMYEFFGDKVLFSDGEDMTISYIFESSLERMVLIAQEIKALPKPMGVGLNISFVSEIDLFFGTLDYSATAIPDTMAGFKDYSQDPVGGWLTY